jgi:hypothetical protein
MGDLDHLTISRILGSKVQPFSRPGFGGFSALRSVGEMLAWRPKTVVPLARDDSRDAKIVAAFAKIHGGYSVDRVLSEPKRAERFIDECRILRLEEPAVLLNRRLLRIRKATDLPIRLPKTTKEDRRDLTAYLIPAELAFAQLSYRYDATVDDLNADPEVGAYFDALVLKVGQGGSAIDHRLAALHLRKNVRARSSDEKRELVEVGETELDHRWKAIGPLANITPTDLPKAQGIFALIEPRRFIYLTKYPDLREGVERFRDQRIVTALGNRFWTPSPESISVEVIQAEMNGTSLRLLELKALEVYRPIFNLSLAA